MSAPEPAQAFPLSWPLTQRRTLDAQRKAGAFKATFWKARQDLLDELTRLGACDVVISTDVPLRRDNLPYADGDPADPGVAVYFKRRQRTGGPLVPFVVACDTYRELRFNVRAVGATIEALRTIERHGGSALMEQAFTGFAALPPARTGGPSWWEVLGIHQAATPDQIEGAHRHLVEQHHPDLPGGSTERMAEINRARDVALAERGLR